MSLSDRIANSLGLDNFDKRHKVGLSLLIVAIIAITSLWVVQLRRNIISPLYAGSQNNQSVAANQPTQNEIDLKLKDTDSDGLNDWDELNLYKTSPYLADTDSDTFPDKQEIDSNNDPTCPQGQSCASTTSITNTETESSFSNSSLENLLNNTVSGTATISPTTTPSTEETKTLSVDEKKALRDAFGVNPNAKDLRQFLLQAGMNQKTLDGLSDEQIVATFNEMIQ
jgi:hypothetical protein